MRLGKMDEKGCYGAPGFVAEVVSPSSRSMDYLLKLTRYRDAYMKTGMWIWSEGRL